MEYETLEAGRKLDALVAEHVMGWTDVGRNQSPHVSGFEYSGVPSQEIASPYTGYKARRNVPRYSTHMGEAWEIVEHFIRHRIAIAITPTEDQEKKVFYAATAFDYTLESLDPNDLHNSIGAKIATTAPTAICNLALKLAGYKGTT